MFQRLEIVEIIGDYPCMIFRYAAWGEQTMSTPDTILIVRRRFRNRYSAMIFRCKSTEHVLITSLL